MTKTIREVTVKYLENISAGVEVTIPAGTEVKQITDGLGKKEWVVVSVGLLMWLTGNTHDPIYRYCTVPADAVDTRSGQPKPGPWKFRTVENDDGGVGALLLETEHRPIPCNDPCVLAIREDWLGYLTRTKDGQATLRLIEAAPMVRDLLRIIVDQQCGIYERPEPDPLDGKHWLDTAASVLDALEE